MAVVIDASIAVAWCLRDRPGTPDADDAIEQGGIEGITVPDLFWHEVRSTLLVGERKDVRMLSIETDANHADEAVSILSQT